MSRPRRRVITSVVVAGSALALAVQGMYLPASAAPRVASKATQTAAHPVAANSAPQSNTLCEHNQHKIVHDPQGQAYQIRNPYWHGKNTMCIMNNNAYTNFSVTSEPGFNTGGRVVAFPDIFRGCIWHICSPDARIPIRVSNILHLATTWRTRQRAPGTWNAAYDIWFNKHNSITGQSDGAELMIWLNENGACCAIQRGAPTVKIDGRQYRMSHWVTTGERYGVSWNYIQLRMTKSTWHVNHLRLKPIIRRCIKMGLIKRSWWLENVEAGFEMWSGGQGLTTSHFRVHVRPRKWGYLHKKHSPENPHVVEAARTNNGMAVPPGQSALLTK